MTVAPLHPEEARRQLTLDCLSLLDTAADEYLNTLVRVARNIFGVDTVLISLVDRDRQFFKARIGLELSETHRDIAFCAHTILSPDSLIVSNALEDPRFCDNPLVVGGPNFRMYAGHPIRVHGFPIGTLCLLHPQPRTLSEAEQTLLVDLATLAEGYVLHRIQNTQLRELYQSLDAERHRAMTDSLTQTWNREGLQYFSQALISDAAKSGLSVGALYCDLDHFKAINDKHGHSVGDRALIHAARQLRATLRSGDLLVRLGGEEFLILMLASDVGELGTLASRVCAAVAEVPARGGEDVEVFLTASIGATLVHPDEALEAALDRANRALFAAKANGRNRIELG